MVTPPQTVARVRIRQIRPDDQDELSGFYSRLSAESRLARFHAVSLGIGERTASLLCGPDHLHGEGFVAEPDGAAADAGGGGLVGHICLEPCETGLEMAIAVADDWQGRGVGRALLLAAIDWARDHGVSRLQATALSTNTAVLALVASTGRAVRERMPAAGVVHVTMDIGGARDQAA
jgi:GNAT superfamily N-acetyltransferase